MYFNKTLFCCIIVHNGAKALQQEWSENGVYRSRIMCSGKYSRELMTGSRKNRGCGGRD